MWPLTSLFDVGIGSNDGSEEGLPDFETDIVPV